MKKKPMTKAERIKIARRIDAGELTPRKAATLYGVTLQTIFNWMTMKEPSKAAPVASADSPAALSGEQILHHLGDILEVMSRLSDQLDNLPKQISRTAIAAAREACLEILSTAEPDRNKVAGAVAANKKSNEHLNGHAPR